MAMSSVVLRKKESAANNHVPHNQSLAFQLKCGLELERLQIQLRAKLRDDLLKLQCGEFYADVILISEESRRSATHSSILRVRTPDFYEYVITNNISGRERITANLPNVRHSQIQSFLRLVYSSENVKHDEKCFLKFLQDKNKLHKQANNCIILNDSLSHGSHYNFTAMNEDILDENVVSEESESGPVDHGHLLSNIANVIQSEIGATESYDSSFKNENASHVIDIGASNSTEANNVYAKEESLWLQTHDTLETDVSCRSSSSIEVADDDKSLRDEQEVVAAHLEETFHGSAYTVENGEAIDSLEYKHNCGNFSETIDCPVVESLEAERRSATSSCTHSLPESPADSLRKDDSLEFCPDSLASDDALLCVGSIPSGVTIDQHPDSEVTVSSTSPLFSDSVSVHHELKHNAVRVPSIDICRSSTENESVRKRAWTLACDMPMANPLFMDLRRLSLGGEEFHNESVVKPSAIVTPYNATNDVLNTNVDNLANGTSSGASALTSEPLLTENSTNFTSVPPRNQLESRCQVQFEVVPFLKEVAGGSVQGISYNGVENPIETGDNLVERRSDMHNFKLSANQVAEASAGAVNKKSVFMFIDTKNTNEQLDTKNGFRSCGDDRGFDKARTNVESVLAPPPVYMFIDVTSNSAAKPLKEATDTVVQRRRVAAINQPRKRPKSESAVTLLKKVPVTEKTAKRTSQVLEVRSDSVYSDSEIVRSFDDDSIKSLYGPCSKLGKDLLNMFLMEIDPDVTVRVAGRDIKAHKSVLISRCCYFAAMFSGGWVESSGNIIKLQGFSYDAVHFAMCHIYSGASSVPANVDISELASLADMFGLEGLKDVVTLYLKMNYCHFFHKPCSSCTTRVSECLLIAVSFGLDELQDKCLRWINKHMLRTWPTKSFAALPNDILQKCLSFAKIEVTVDTVLDVIMRCDKLTATLPHVKWTDPVLTLVAGLAEECSEFLSKNFAKILKSNSFLVLRSGETWDLHALETTFLVAVERLFLDVACRAYAHLHDHLEVIRRLEYSDSSDLNENFETLVRKIHRQVELLLIHNANQVAQCPGWALLSSDLQKIIMDAAVIVIEFEKPTAPPPVLSSFNKRFTRSTIENKTREVLISPSAITRRLTASCSSASKTTGNFQSLKLINNSKKANSKVSEPSKDIRKSTTLPRTSVCKEDNPKRIMQQTHSRISSSSTMPKSSNTKNETVVVASSVKEPRNVSTQPLRNSSSQKRVHSATTSAVGVPISASTSSRPKSWPVNKEDSKLKCLDSTTVPPKKKTPIKEPRDGLREPTSIVGNNKLSSSSLITRSKSVNSRSSEGSISRTTKPLTSNASTRDSRGSSVRKDVKGDNSVKVNNRPKSDLVANNRKLTSKPTTSKAGIDRRSLQ